MIASVLSAVIRPAARWVIWRSAPALPTLTSPTGLSPANGPKVMVPTVALGTAVVPVVTASAPSETELSSDATALGPIATESSPSACESAFVELAWKYLMPWLLMWLITSPTLLIALVVPLLL